MNIPYLSIVIPVHNEQEVLETLFERLTKALDSIGKPFEIIFTNDGSEDNSAEILNAFHEKRPDQVRVIHFNGNFGQHMAIMAGFEHVHGEIAITMDADLQNPPEDIHKLVTVMEKGHDVVGGYRMDRQDKLWRKFFSRAHNILRDWITPAKIKMKDEGCMLRAYRRDIVDLMVASQEASTFIPALALTYACNPAEIGVSHEERSAGETSYNFYSLMRYNFDLITNFSLVPLQLFTFIGIVVSFFSTLFVGYLFARRLIVGPEAEGLFTLFAILFFLIGIVLMGLGITGEYIGRIYQEVRKRPRFIINKVVEKSRTTEKTS